jgi:uncharacterized protein YodC (DUF2158 family)
MKAGDVVILKGGGPSMTVTFVRESSIDCIWFDLNTHAGPFSLTVQPDALKVLDKE